MNQRDALFVAGELLAAVALGAFSPAAWAGPPYRTDDPEAVEYKHAEFVTLGAEIFHATEQTAGLGARTGFNVGGFCNIDEHNHVLFSAGKGLKNAAQTNRVSSYLAYQYTF